MIEVSKTVKTTQTFRTYDLGHDRVLGKEDNTRIRHTGLVSQAVNGVEELEIGYWVSSQDNLASKKLGNEIGMDFDKEIVFEDKKVHIHSTRRMVLISSLTGRGRLL